MGAWPSAFRVSFQSKSVSLWSFTQAFQTRGVHGSVWQLHLGGALGVLARVLYCVYYVCSVVLSAGGGTARGTARTTLVNACMRAIERSANVAQAGRYKLVNARVWPAAPTFALRQAPLLVSAAASMVSSTCAWCAFVCFCVFACLACTDSSVLCVHIAAAPTLSWRCTAR